MFEVLGITAPIFILIGLGFLGRRFGWLSQEQVRGLGVFVINLALPALVIEALGQRPIREVLNPHYLAAYALGSLAAYGAGFWLFRKRHQAGLTDSAIAALGMAVSNSAFIGYPVAAIIAGPEAVVGMALGMLVENLLMTPLALVLGEVGRGQGGSIGQVAWQTAKRVARNPLIIGISVGVLLSSLEIRIPAAPLKVVQMLAHAAAPVALFVIGAVLYGTPVRGQLAPIVQIGLGKLVLHPLLVGLGFWLIGGLPMGLMLAGLVFASAPMMSVYPVIGQRFALEGRCAAALVLTTLLSFFTISALLMALRA
ncbi:AEC family transporter [Pseudomonas sp. NPDC007930]|uniref:AEC family transporter n=1 Tax=Pseudomonas sp. NPDC007930 TaxID=3364417 RepID=UPI0036E6D7DA